MGFGSGAFTGGSGGGSGSSSGEYTLGLNEKLILDGDTYWVSEADDEASFFAGGNRRAKFSSDNNETLRVFGGIKIDADRHIGSSTTAGLLRLGATVKLRENMHPDTDAEANLGVSSAGWAGMYLAEVTAPATPTTAGVLYIADDGSGGKELRVKFANGQEKVITTHTA